jgi:hypothetical protein
MKEWRVSHGDLFALGPETNEAYCHAVPFEETAKNLRISVIFRSISKSFINLEATEKSVEYASGKVKSFKAECISTSGYDDIGTKQHIADLIASREIKKLAKKLVNQNMLHLDTLRDMENLSKYYMGEGSCVPSVK